MKRQLFVIIFLSFVLACDKAPEDIEIQTIYDFELQVINAKGEPLEGISVELYAQLESEKFISNDVTDNDGKIYYKDLYIGKYSIYASFISGLISASTDLVVNTVGDNKETLVLNFDPKENNSPIIISGFHSDPRGSDGAAAGTSSSYNSTGIIVTHNGGYEYVQLLALEYIDFSETPYSVVICNNGAVEEGGWAAGGSSTYKFNLTSGTAEKGTFFYVGGMSKVISGYGDCGKSTDIRSANWIRTIDYKSSDGDGFGSKTSGLLGNRSSIGSNISDGIAVFEGVEVTEQSVPIDAIFYGTEVIPYDAEKGWGYRIPKNDHYNPVNPETSGSQPFFGQGTNIFLFDQPASDIGDYSQLGGIITNDMWLAPRSRSSIKLSYCPGESSLDDIELGKSVTTFIDNGR